MTLPYIHDVDPETTWVLDIEADGLWEGATKIHMACVMRLDGKVNSVFFEPETFLNWLAFEGNPRFIAHNGISYDIPMLNKFWGSDLNPWECIDTMMLSQMYNPTLEGGHSLASWGHRLKCHKGDFDGPWDVMTSEMLEYCKQDVLLCRKLYVQLSRRMRAQEYTDLGIEIEHRMWHIMTLQRLNGCHFAVQNCRQLHAQLTDVVNAIEEKKDEYWPPEFLVVATYKKPYKADGSPTANFDRHSREFPRVEVHPDGSRYRCYDWVPFNLGSSDQRVKKLLELGWKPREFTDGGNPQPTKKGKLNPSLQEFVDKSGLTQVNLLAAYLNAEGRRTALNTWMEAYNDNTGAIHGSVWLANTLRYRHRDPNTANIPAVRLDRQDLPILGEEGGWTYEARSCWTTRDREHRRFVGVDASGIQIRELAHYTNNKALIDAILSGDVHEANKENWHLDDRRLAKTILYSTLMGAGDKLVASQADVSLKEAKGLKKAFFAGVPEFQPLVKCLKDDVAKTGRIKLCDGTPIRVTKPHTVIPFLLQGDESRIMKVAAWIIYTECIRRGLDVLKVLDVHDEHQYDVALGDVEELTTDIFPAAFAQAGELFKYLLPIACDSHVGLTWAETH